MYKYTCLCVHICTCTDKSHGVQVTGPMGLRVVVCKKRGAITTLEANGIVLITASANGDMLGSDGVQVHLPPTLAVHSTRRFSVFDSGDKTVGFCLCSLVGSESS